MQLLSEATNSGGDTLGTPETVSDALPSELATELATLALDTVPPVMRAIRTMMRAASKKDLTVPQFRVLGFVDRRGRASVKDVAEHLGIPMSGASRLVEKLVDRKLVARTTDPKDRRRVILTLRPAGKRLRVRARERTQQGLATTFQRLTPAERDAIARALPVLRDLFSNEPSEPNAASASGETSATTGEPPPS